MAQRSLGSPRLGIERARWTLGARSSALRRARTRLFFSLDRDNSARQGFTTLIIAAENHFAGGGLVNRRDADIDSPVDQLARAVDDDHGPIIQIGNALVVFFPFAQNEDAHDLAGQDDGLERVRELVDVHDLNSLKRSDFVEVEIVRNDFRVVALSHLDQLQIHLDDVREIVFGDLHLQMRHFLDALEHLEAAPASLALQRIGRIGDELQLVQDKLRNNYCAVQKQGIGDVCHAAVDDHARIQQFERIIHTALAPKKASERLQVQHVFLVSPEHQADVVHHEENGQAQE